MDLLAPAHRHPVEAGLPRGDRVLPAAVLQAGGLGVPGAAGPLPLLAGQGLRRGRRPALGRLRRHGGGVLQPWFLEEAQLQVPRPGVGGVLGLALDEDVVLAALLAGGGAFLDRPVGVRGDGAGVLPRAEDRPLRAAPGVVGLPEADLDAVAVGDRAAAAGHRDRRDIGVGDVVQRDPVVQLLARPDGAAVRNALVQLGRLDVRRGPLHLLRVGIERVHPGVRRVHPARQHRHRAHRRECRGRHPAPVALPLHALPLVVLTRRRRRPARPRPVHPAPPAPPLSPAVPGSPRSSASPARPHRTDTPADGHSRKQAMDSLT